MAIPPQNHHHILLSIAKGRLLPIRRINDIIFNGPEPFKGGVFNRDIFDEILRPENNCHGIRFYFAFAIGNGVGPNNNGVPIGEMFPTIMICGVDANGNNLPLTDLAVGENSWPCPTHCSQINELTPL